MINNKYFKSYSEAVMDTANYFLDYCQDYPNVLLSYDKTVTFIENNEFEIGYLHDKDNNKYIIVVDVINKNFKYYCELINSNELKFYRINKNSEKESEITCRTFIKKIKEAITNFFMS